MITGGMTSAERVAEFLRIHRGAWYCDGCISEIHRGGTVKSS